jgi:hypothetical protein
VDLHSIGGLVRISVSSKGDLNKTEAFLRKVSKLDVRRELDAAGKMGVKALASATPRDSGLAADSWDYKISGGRGGARITWINTDVENGFPVAIMLQYGYGTGTGGYVQGQDYINPAMRPIFDQIAEKVWKAVTSA